VLTASLASHYGDVDELVFEQDDPVEWMSGFGFGLVD